MSLHPHLIYGAGHNFRYCHDDMHVDGDSCPDCGGYRIGCPDPKADHQTPSDRSQPRASAASGAGASGGGSSTSSDLPRPAATDRVTYDSPFAVEQDVQDESWIVTVGLTNDAARQLARDLTRRHMADLILLNRMCIQERMYRHTGAEADEANARDVARTIETRLSGALQSMATTQWTLTPGQAEQLTDDLEDAQAEPEPCAVGTCSAYSIDGSSYCAPHDEGI